MSFMSQISRLLKNKGKRMSICNTSLESKKQNLRVKNNLININVNCSMYSVGTLRSHYFLFNPGQPNHAAQPCCPDCQTPLTEYVQIRWNLLDDDDVNNNNNNNNHHHHNHWRSLMWPWQPGNRPLQLRWQHRTKLPSMLGSPQTTISSRLQWSLLALPTSQLLTSSRRSEIK